VTQERIRLTAVTLTFAAAIFSLGYVGCVAETAQVFPAFHSSSPSSMLGEKPLKTEHMPVSEVSVSPNDSPRALPHVDAFPLALQVEQEMRSWTHIIFHHTATGGGDVEAIDAVHRERTDEAGRPWLGIGYHFVIGNGNGMPDGLIEPTFRWTEQLHGAHAGDRLHNETGIGICLVGNFEQGPPSERQLASLKQLVSMLRSQFDISSEYLLGHGEFKSTACPGRFFPLQEVISATEEELLLDRDAVAEVLR